MCWPYMVISNFKKKNYLSDFKKLFYLVGMLIRLFVQTKWVNVCKDKNFISKCYNNYYDKLKN